MSLVPIIAITYWVSTSKEDYVVICCVCEGCGWAPSWEEGSS